MKTTLNTCAHYIWQLLVSAIVLGLLAVPAAPAQAQTFTLDTPLLTARWGHAATLLTNGLVLIAGGRIANDYVNSEWANTNNCELYNPATGSSTLTGPMNDSHFAGAAMMLTNGQVLIVSGENNGQYPITGAELYDTVSGTWTSTGSLQQRRASFAATMLNDGRVLVVGGYDGGSGDELSSAEIYSPNTTIWTNAAAMSFAADSQTATLLPNGTVLVAGGSIDGNSLTNALLYKPANNIWTNTGGMNVARSSHTATLLPNGRVLVVGGGDESAEIYDPTTGIWTLVAPMNDGRFKPSATLLPNGQVLVLGGYPGQTSAELYDPTNNTWTYTDPLNVGRIDHTATLVSQGQVVVAGGDASDYNGPALADVETYNQAGSFFGDALNTTNLTWSSDGDLPWFTETTVTLDGLAAQSGPITDSQSSYLETTVPADGQLSFNWKVSSESGADFLTFYINGYEQDSISGDVDWFPEDYQVSAGDVLRWEYAKDYSDSDGLDAGFLDEVSYVAAPPSPELTVTASTSSGQAPLSVQFTSPGLDSFGNTITNWNWDFGDGGTSTAQSPSHTFTSGGYYSPSLIAYSTYGTTPLTVNGPGAINVTNLMLNVSVTPPSGLAPLTVQFFSPTTDSAGNTVTNWSWTFGDGGTSTARNPTHIYTSISSFTPGLTARSTHGTLPLDVTGLDVINTYSNPVPAFRTLYTFSPNFGSGPNAGLTISGNTLYGTTVHGGISSLGTVFAIHTDGSGFTNIYNNFVASFTNGADPNGGLVLSGGTLYGTAYIGGKLGGGTVFALGTNGLGFTNLANFDFNVNPNSPDEPLTPVVLSGGTLYGTTWYGGSSDHGTVFSVASNGASSGILHSFSTPIYNPNANNSDGIFPSGKLVVSGGTLYGTAENAGLSGGGTVFSVITNQPNNFSVLHYFTTPVNGTNSDGAYSFAGLVLSGTNLYGTTYGGGTHGYGVVFAVSTNGYFTNLYNFTGTNDGSQPHGGLTLSGNRLYGTTSAGGAYTNGTLFAINTDGSNFKSLYSFTGTGDGGNPQADLAFSGGTLYGTAEAGTIATDGTVFSYTLTGPPLTIARSGTNVILTWSASATGYTLQSSLQLGATAAWSSVSPLPVVLNSLNTVTNPISTATKFYRLSQ